MLQGRVDTIWTLLSLLYRMSSPLVVESPMSFVVNSGARGRRVLSMNMMGLRVRGIVLHTYNIDRCTVL